MYTKDFYNKVDEQLSVIVDENKENQFFKKKDDVGKKSAAFLMWFIKRYNPNLTQIEEHITDGDDDSSCDIIFPNDDNLGEEVYYVVQSKWNTIKNIGG